MLLPVSSMSKTLATVITLERFDVIVDCLNVPGEIFLHAELDPTHWTLVIHFLVVYSLEVPGHVFLFSEPSPTLFTIMIHTLMDHQIVL